jgi:hypothetical protein
MIQKRLKNVFLTISAFYPLGQRRSEDYTGMQRGQARFFTYYRFLALRRHCSVGFRCAYTSRFQEIQKRFIENKL